MFLSLFSTPTSPYWMKTMNAKTRLILNKNHRSRTTNVTMSNWMRPETNLIAFKKSLHPRPGWRQTNPLPPPPHHIQGDKRDVSVFGKLESSESFVYKGHALNWLFRGYIKNEFAARGCVFMGLYRLVICRAIRYTRNNAYYICVSTLMCTFIWCIIDEKLTRHNMKTAFHLSHIITIISAVARSCHSKNF